MPLSQDDLIILVLLIGEASGVFAGFCPSWFTVASPFFHEQSARDGNVKRIRAGEIAATVIVVATGWAVSRNRPNNIGLWASVIISAVFVAGYEYQIAHPSKSEPGQIGPEKPPSNGARPWRKPFPVGETL
jgi:hypothetical protein